MHPETQRRQERHDPSEPLDERTADRMVQGRLRPQPNEGIGQVNARLDFQFKQLL